MNPAIFPYIQTNIIFAGMFGSIYIAWLWFISRHELLRMIEAEDVTIRMFCIASMAIFHLLFTQLSFVP